MEVGFLYRLKYVLFLRIVGYDNRILIQKEPTHLLTRHAMIVIVTPMMNNPPTVQPAITYRVVSPVQQYNETFGSG